MQKHDVVIIGSGIGGLVAGTYLAKQGIKTLILERREKVGGYCGSFLRDGFIYDDAVHYINNMGPGGVLRHICEELDIFSQLKVIRIDPSDWLRMRELEFAVHNDISKTVQELSSLFPKEISGIEAFFETVSKFNFSELYARYHKMTFQNVLQEFFRDVRLQTALGIFSTTLGLLPDKLSGLAGLAYYRGSIIDGGYHPIGGAQKLSDALLGKFRQHGGSVSVSTTVTRIVANHSRVTGVELDNGELLSSRVVVSNCDATQTFVHLLRDTPLAERFKDRIQRLQPSLSNFIVYLGLKGKLGTEVPSCCNYWHFPFMDYKQASVDITEDERTQGFAHISFPTLHDRSMAPDGFESIMVFTGASYKDQKYWESNKTRLMEIVIKRVGEVIPNLEGRIVTKFAATPHTLFRYTLNREGSYRGWAPTIEQTKADILTQKTEIPGLFLAGHWVTTPVGHGGVSMVAQSGKNVSSMVARFLERQPEVSSRLN